MLESILLNDMKMKKLFLAVLFMVPILSCTSQKDSSLKTVVPVEFPDPTKANISYEYCEDTATQADCLTALKTIEGGERDLMILAVGTSFAEREMDKVEANILLEIGNIREAVMNLQNDGDDFFSQFDKRDAENQLRSIFSALLTGRQNYEDYIQANPYDNKPDNTSVREWYFSSTDCASEAASGVISVFFYFICKEEKLIQSLRDLVNEKKLHADIVEEYFSSIDPALYVDLTSTVNYLQGIIDQRNNALLNYFHKIRVRSVALEAGTIVNTNLSSTPWIATQADPSLWRGIIYSKLDRINTINNKTQTLTNSIANALEQGISLDIEDIKNNLLLVENEQAQADLEQEINQIKTEIKLLDEEIENNSDRLIQGASKIVPVNDYQEIGAKRFYLDVTKYSDLAYKDCSNESCTSANGLVIDLPMGTSSIKLAVEGDPTIVANGIYHNLNRWQLGFEKFLYYYQCLTGAFLGHANFSSSWCTNDLPSYINDEEVKPFTPTYSYDANASPNHVYHPDYNNTAHMVVPCLVDKDQPNPLTLNPATDSIEDVLASIPTLTDLSNAAFRLCRVPQWTSYYRSLGEEERLNYVKMILGEHFQKDYDLYLALKDDLKKVWSHRKGAITNLDGYFLRVNEGETVGVSKSKGMSASFGISSIVSLTGGFATSTTRSSATSKGGTITYGFFHDGVPDPTSVVGKLMGECLDSNGASFSEKQFLGFGQSSTRTIPSGCHKIMLFINDDPSGIDPSDSSSCIVNINEDGTPEYPGFQSKWAHIFRQGSTSAFVANDSAYGCTYLDKPFIIGIGFSAPTEAQQEAGLMYVTDEQLRALFGEEDGVVGIVSNPNAESIAIDVFNQHLDSSGISLSETVRDILHRYVLAWISGEKMKYQRDQLQTRLALLASENTGDSTSTTRLENQAQLISKVSSFVTTAGTVNTMKLGFAKEMRNSYQKLLRKNLLDITHYLNLYLDSHNYHYPKSGVTQAQEIVALIDTFRSYLGLRLTTDYSEPTCDLSTLPDDIPNDLKLELCSLELGYMQILLDTEIAALMDEYVADAEITDKIRSRIVQTGYTHCELPVFENTDVEVISSNIVQVTNGWGTEPEADPVTMKSFETLYVPLKLTDNLFNPDFDDEKACDSYSENAEKVSCLANIANYRAGIVSVPMLDGYYEISSSVNLQDQGCFNSDHVDPPQIIFSTLEVQLESTSGVTQDTSLRDMKIVHSPLVSYSTDDSGIATTYMTFIDYYSYAPLANQLLSVGGWRDAEHQRIKVAITGMTDAGCTTTSGWNSDACFQFMLGINSDTMEYPISALTHMRPEMNYTLVIPAVNTQYDTELANQYRIIVSHLDTIKLHLFMQVESL